jgi:hypothetical protein
LPNDEWRLQIDGMMIEGLMIDGLRSVEWIDEVAIADCGHAFGNSIGNRQSVDRRSAIDNSSIANRQSPIGNEEPWAS